MSIQLINGSEFLHIPKTGGTWVRAVLADNDLIASSSGVSHRSLDQHENREFLSQSGRAHLKLGLKLITDNTISKIKPRGRIKSDF